MSRTDVFEVRVQGRDLTREEVLGEFRAGEDELNMDIEYEDQNLEIRTYPPMFMHRWWPTWMPDPVWIVRWERVVFDPDDV